MKVSLLKAPIGGMTSLLSNPDTFMQAHWESEDRLQDAQPLLAAGAPVEKQHAAA